MNYTKKFIIIFASLVLPFLGLAQQTAETTQADTQQTEPAVKTQPAAEPQAKETAPEPKLPGRVYVSPDGKIFIKGKTPVYLRLTTSPEDGAPSYILKNKSSTDANLAPSPFEFEGHGKHSIVHPNDHRAPQKDKDDHIFPVNDDGKSPRSKVSVTKAPWVYNGNVNIYGKPVKISLDFTDKDSGVFAGYYALNSDEFSTYTDPIALEMEMDYTLTYYALDNVGNKSKQRVRYYALDFTPPETVYKVLGPHIIVVDEDVLSPRSRLSLKARDLKAGVKNIRYRFKGKKGVYQKTPLTMKGLKDGPHNLVYGAEDRVKNAETNKTFRFYLDSMAPAVYHKYIGDQFRKDKTTYVSDRTNVALSASDNKAGVKRIRYSVNSKGIQTYSDPFRFPRRNGKATFSYKASDKVLNLSPTTAKSVVVDISPPKVKLKFKGEHYFSRKTHYIRLGTTVTLSTTDNLSGIQSVGYTLDQNPTVFDGKPFQVVGEGPHTLVFSAKDNVNNERPEKTATLFVDEKAPEIYHHFSVNPTLPEQQVYPLKSLLYLAATDKRAGIRNIYYSINGSKEKKYKKPLSFKKRRDYLVKIRSIDNVGNISTSEVEFKIK